MRATAIVLTTVCLMILGLSALAVAGVEITVEVTSIAASMRAGEDAEEAADSAIDPRLVGLARKLQSLFAYSHYSFLGRVQTSTELGRTAAAELPEHFLLEVEPVRFDRDGDDRIEMMVTLLRDAQPQRPEGMWRRPRREMVLRTKIRLKSGGTVLLGGPPIRGGVLILALSARR